jgi:hypothetical protein
MIRYLLYVMIYIITLFNTWIKVTLTYEKNANDNSILKLNRCYNLYTDNLNMSFYPMISPNDLQSKLTGPFEIDELFIVLLAHF